MVESTLKRFDVLGYTGELLPSKRFFQFSMHNQKIDDRENFFDPTCFLDIINTHELLGFFSIKSRDNQKHSINSFSVKIKKKFFEEKKDSSSWPEFIDFTTKKKEIDTLFQAAIDESFSMGELSPCHLNILLVIYFIEEHKLVIYSVGQNALLFYNGRLSGSPVFPVLIDYPPFPVGQKLGSKQINQDSFHISYDNGLDKDGYFIYCGTPDIINQTVTGSPILANTMYKFKKAMRKCTLPGAIPETELVTSFIETIDSFYKSNDMKPGILGLLSKFQTEE